MSNQKFDINKCKRDERGYLMAQTRDGRKVRIIEADCGYKDSPILAQIENALPATWLSDGRAFLNGTCEYSDLVNIPEKRVVWVNVYENCMVGEGYKSKELADQNQSKFNARIACVRVEFTEGEGL